MYRRDFLAMPAPAALALQSANSGWQRLFDGATFANFSLSRLSASTWWKIEDGWIQSIPQGASREGRRLFTLESFQDFDLVFEWKVSHAGNSGVKYRIQRTWTSDPQTPQPPSIERLMTDTALGFEYQIADDEHEPAALATPLARTGALYGVLAPNNPAPVKAGTIHITRIAVAGARFEHWLDERKVLEDDLHSQAVQAALSAKRDAAGTARNYESQLARYTAESLLRYDTPASPIDFQHHRSGIAFRNIRIRRR